MEKIRAAVVQMVSSADPAANIRAMRRLVRQAADAGAGWVLLPEYWPLMGHADTDKLAVAEAFGAGRFQTALAEAAAECGVVLFGGTIPLHSGEAGKVLNSMPVYGRDGTLLGRYDKMHLFGYSGLGERYAEADTIAAGGSVPKLAADGWPLAAGAGYLLRPAFPRIFPRPSPFRRTAAARRLHLHHGQSALGVAAARPRGGKPVLCVGGGTGRQARERAAYLRPQHDYRPLGRHSRRSA